MFEYDLFLCYWEQDADKAEKVKIRAEECGLRVFMAQYSIQPSQDWEQTIRNALIDSRELAFIATKKSITRPWLLTECGAHWLLERPVTPLLADCNGSDIAPHFMRHQAVCFDQLEVFINGLCIRSRDFPAPHGLIRHYETKYRNQVQRTLIAGTLADSPFDAMTLFQESKQSIFFAGKNLHYLLVTNGDRTKEMLEAFFNRNPKNNKCHFLINDPGFEAGVKTWSATANPELFKIDLEAAVDTLKNWSNEFKKRGYKFSARLTEFVYISSTFVDPETDFGRGYLLLNTGHSSPGTKTCILLSKQEHPGVFKNHWDNYNLAFQRAKNKELGDF